MWYSFYFSSCKLNFGPKIMRFALSSGSKNRQCAVLFFSFFFWVGDFSICHHVLSHYAPLCPLFSIWKNHKTQPVCRIMSGKHGNNHPSRTKHSQVFSWNVGAKKDITLAAFCICQEWECHRFSRSGTGCRGRGGIRGAIMAVRPILSPWGLCCTWADILAAYNRKSETEQVTHPESAPARCIHSVFCCFVSRSDGVSMSFMWKFKMSRLPYVLLLLCRSMLMFPCVSKSVFIFSLIHSLCLHTVTNEVSFYLTSTTKRGQNRSD